MTTPIPATAWPSYLRWMLACAFGCILAAGAVVLAIDPLGAFGSPRIVGINAQKPYFSHHREEIRWHLARQVCADAAIFGNSRAEIGFDPENEAFATLARGAFNHAVPGTTLQTSLRQVHWLDQAGCMPKLWVVGVEFFDFLGGTDAPLPAADADPMPMRDARFLAETVFSLSGIGDAATTVVSQRMRHPARLTERGFNPLLPYLDEVALHGQYALFRQAADANVKRWQALPPRLTTANGSPSTDSRALDGMLDIAAARSATVHLVIYPYHAQIRLLAARLGLAALYDTWRRDLVARVAARVARGEAITLWDFSAVSDTTQEPIPPRGDKTSQTHDYWEAGHFKPALGGRMLAQMLQGKAGFGVALDPAMVDSWLARDAAALQLADKNNTVLRDEVDDIVKSAGVLRKR